MQHRANLSLARFGFLAGAGVALALTHTLSPVWAEEEASATTMMAPAPSEERVQQGARLISDAIALAERRPTDSRVRIAVARGAAALLPRLTGDTRQGLTRRWQRIALSPQVPRSVRDSAFDAFFDVASRNDIDFANATALTLPDAGARAGAFLQLSQAVEKIDWQRSNDYVTLAQRAARQEGDSVRRARALTFIASRLAVVNPETREAAMAEAYTEVRHLQGMQERDALLTELVAAAALYDLNWEKKLAATIGTPRLRNLAEASINIAEASSMTVTASTADRIAALAKAAVRYDSRAIPILLQLPPRVDVLHALGDALPPIYPSATPAISTTLLERMWNYTQKAEASVYRDQLQSRLARLMVLKDLWRGRSWGKQLAWKGGRIQVGAFLKQVIETRRSRLRAEPLQDVAESNVQRAISQARSLPPAEQAEALLLIAGQILG
jgi:hypothetical protein